MNSTPLCMAAALALSGCLYTNVREPLAYGSATPGDVNGNLGKEVTGSACNVGILWLVAVGDGGFDAAVKDARASVNGNVLVDVKSDTQYTNVLFGLYQRQCTVVTGRVGAVASAAPAPPAATGAAP